MVMFADATVISVSTTAIAGIVAVLCILGGTLCAAGIAAVIHLSRIAEATERHATAVELKNHRES